MFTRKETALIALAVVCSLSGTVGAQELPGLGTPVSAAELAELDYTILPDGNGLPAGSGTVAEGEAVFQQHCLACHGEGAAGGINDALTGGQGSLSSDNPLKTVGSFWPHATTIFDYVRRAMPLQSPGILSNDEVYAVTAYLLFQNGIIPADSEVDAESLPQVKMPNREGFIWAYRPK